MLGTIHGSENDGAAPYRFRKLLLTLRKLATTPQEKENSKDSVDPTEFMRKAISEEMLSVAKLRGAAAEVEKLKLTFNHVRERVPSEEVSDRLMRYEAHLSREFDRTLSQLERLQRMRMGQPVLPPIKLDLSS